jgi:hypothetical protein
MIRKSIQVLSSPAIDRSFLNLKNKSLLKNLSFNCKFEDRKKLTLLSEDGLREFKDRQQREDFIIIQKEREQEVKIESMLRSELYEMETQHLKLAPKFQFHCYPKRQIQKWRSRTTK